MAKDNLIMDFLPILEIVRDNQSAALSNTEKMIARAKGEQAEDLGQPEIFIIDAAAIPAAYYLRDSVVAAVKAEILRDHINGQPIPAGASLKNEVEARSGETDQISDPSDDNPERGTGPEDAKSGADDGPKDGSSDPYTGGSRG